MLVIGWICSRQRLWIFLGGKGVNPTMHLITDNQVAHIILSHHVFIESVCAFLRERVHANMHLCARGLTFIITVLSCCVVFLIFLFLICKYLKKMKSSSWTASYKTWYSCNPSLHDPDQLHDGRIQEEVKKNTQKIKTKKTKMRLCSSAASSALHQKKMKYLSCSLNSPPSLHPSLLPLPSDRTRSH